MVSDYPDRLTSSNPLRHQKHTIDTNDLTKIGCIYDIMCVCVVADYETINMSRG